MKKFMSNILLVGLVLSIGICLLSACENKEITMQEIINANSTKILLNKYDSVAIEKKYDLYGTERVLYVDNEIEYIGSGDVGEVYTNERRYGYASGSCSAILEAKSRNLSQFENFAFFKETAYNEEIVNVKEQDATIFFVTQLKGENAQKEFETLDVKLSDGDYIEKEYVVNKSDYFVLTCKAYVCTETGSKTMYYESKSESDAQRPKAAEILAEKLSEKDVRNVTLVLDPGTAYERRFSTLAVKGDGVIPSLPGGYENFYSNERCTIPFAGSADYVSDLVVYSKRTGDIVETVTKLEYGMNYRPDKFEMTSLENCDVFKYTGETEQPITVTVQRYENQNAYKVAEDIAAKLEKSKLKPETVNFGKDGMSSWLIYYMADAENEIVSTVAIQHGEDVVTVETKSFKGVPEEVDTLLEEMFATFEVNKTVF